MSEVEEITQLMSTDDPFVGWLKSLPPKKKVGDPRLANTCPEAHFLRATGHKVLLVGLGEITTSDHKRIPCSWIRKFQQDLLAKFFPKGSRLREVTAQECLSVLRPE